jgi:cytochrome c-type biogenesis protein CcmF
MNSMMIGNLSLGAAVLMTAAALFSAVAAVKFQNDRLLVWGRRLLGLFGLAIVVGSTALLTALVNSDFQNAYVASYTERALPLGYKIAAFWAGQEGSLLFWALLLAGMSAVAVYGFRNRGLTEQSVMIGTLALVCGFFAALMLFAANPFAQLPVAAADGQGLNPMLQDPYMVAHPPLLFIGYAGYTIPWAMLLAALISGRKDNQWIGATRKWLMVSWLFLTLGIVLGAKWAYIELGWGGYWAWDPVENASLLPWLTGTALMHSVMVQQHRGMFKLWNALLIVSTFLLCIFGTYLTRSGVIESVHSFGESPIGMFFLVFLGVCVLLSLGVIVTRHALLKSEHEVQGLMTREGAFLALNVLLVLMTLTTLVGTIFPVLSGAVIDEPISVGQSFYNKAVIPMSLALLAVMSVGPLLGYGKDATKQLFRSLVVPGIAGAVAVVAAVVWGLTNPWALICTAITTVAVFSIVSGMIQAVRQRRKIEDKEGPLTATLRVIDSNHRRYGGQFVHLGVVMLMVGVAGSSLFSTKQTFQLTAGESGELNGYTVTRGELNQFRQANFTAVEAHVTLTPTDPADGGAELSLHPQLRFYDKSMGGEHEHPSAHVALNSTLARDIYMTLAGWEDDGKLIALEAIINPLVAWIWIGTIVMTLGAVFCLVPRLMKETAQAHAPVTKSTKSTKTAKDRPRSLTPATVSLSLAGEGQCASQTDTPTHNPETSS